MTQTETNPMTARENIVADELIDVRRLLDALNKIVERPSLAAGAAGVTKATRGGVSVAGRDRLTLSLSRR